MWMTLTSLAAVAFSADTPAEVGHWEILDSHYLGSKRSEQENQDVVRLYNILIIMAKCLVELKGFEPSTPEKEKGDILRFSCGKHNLPRGSSAEPSSVRVFSVCH